MNRIHLEIPFLLLSVRMNAEGELEKRFLTPFGLIDVVFRRIKGVDKSMHCYDIEVDGDTDCWVSVESVAEDFKNALLEFIMRIVEQDLGGHQESVNFHRLVVRIRGAETKLSLPVRSNSQCMLDQKGAS
ncbi:MAG: hypothetical protein JW884_10115 [Deltaproteobacteria bacterium]|nr:hypothetical protein [Deltaproteobacteria bacterium]